jgi:hypothetical protein
MEPETIGPETPETFADEEFMAGYLNFMRRKFESPETYGCTERDREKAAKAWDKLAAKLGV